MMVPFHRPTRAPTEQEAVASVLSGAAPEGCFTEECERLLRSRLAASYATLTPSCTAALELGAMCLELRPGDEVIVPSFTFPSTANAFLRAGARVVFADVCPRTGNIDPASVERLATPRTRAVVAMHYAGIACDMDTLQDVAEGRGAVVIEDAAHALFGGYKGRALGAVGEMGAFSFHRTKNVSCGEGGAFTTSSSRFAELADVIREKGTDRARFMKGLVHRYDWIREGSSFILAELLAAQLQAQLLHATEIQAKRRRVFERYQSGLAEWASRGGVRQPELPDGCDPAWHLYFLVLPSEALRDGLLGHLQSRGVGAAFHYSALHLTPMGHRLGGRAGDAPRAERWAAGIVRLPLYTDLTEAEQDRVIDAVMAFDPSPSRRLSRLPKENDLV